MNPRLAEETAKLEITIDLDQFSAFDADLYAQNEIMNLTRVPHKESWLRHFLDSLLVAEFIPAGASVLDIGTGPGFPAWPLAAARPDLQVTAMDANAKMVGFLRKHPLPNLEVIQVRAEESGLNNRFDVVTGRALAPLSQQLELSVRPCQLGGCVIPMRTPKDEEEIARLAEFLGLELEIVHRRTLPDIEAERLFPVFRKVDRTPRGYPRPWAKMRERAL